MAGDNMQTLRVPGGGGAAPVPLLQFLFAALPQRKRTDLRRLVADGHVAVNGQTAGPGAQVAPGDTVVINHSRSMGPQLRDRRLRLVYEDDDFIVVDKAAGLLSVAADNQRRRSREGSDQETAYGIVRAYVKRRDPRADLYILHRLDRDTSGLLAFARRPELSETLRANWNNMVRQRRYEAVVRGLPDPPEGTIQSYLSEDDRYQVRSRATPAPGARLAVTSYAVQAAGRGYALVRCLLSTGRKNQIRVHMADRGCPVVGDTRYGAPGAPSPLGRLALHASGLQFIHPFTGRLLSFEAPAPPSFAALLAPPTAPKSR